MGETNLSISNCNFLWAISSKDLSLLSFSFFYISTLMWLFIVLVEESVRKNSTVLPITPLISINKEKKQIDASFSVGDILIIAECRAFALSIGFIRGNPESISFRTEKIQKAIMDIDEKARWLLYFAV